MEGVGGCCLFIVAVFLISLVVLLILTFTTDDIDWSLMDAVGSTVYSASP
ncbi:hypothetical protein OHB05_27520 [Streptomyces sp. NBC_00638]|nr:hypothetical protein [Streptomyces sp. NBC_00638]MCX5006342.1 hypothetical protein [Streptomyces sp. NBC_00638]